MPSTTRGERCRCSRTRAITFELTSMRPSRSEGKPPGRAVFVDLIARQSIPLITGIIHARLGIVTVNVRASSLEIRDESWWFVRSSTRWLVSWAASVFRSKNFLARLVTRGLALSRRCAIDVILIKCLGRGLQSTISNIFAKACYTCVLFTSNLCDYIEPLAP